MAEIGNWPFLTRAREQAFYADTTAQRARAHLAHTAARERLTRLMGLWGEDIGYVLPERLPELPAEAREGGELEAQALRRRLDMQAVNRAADSAIRARSEVRESYAAYRTAFDIARHYRDEIVPLRKRISEEMLLRYNGMLSSVFELLADSRDAVASVNAYLEAQRDFWIAEADLQMALTTGSPAR
jgi:outer membrane protein TolC